MSHHSLPPAQPAFILRGHSAQIHALHFTDGNSRLLTGDAEGWIVSWNLAFKRPVAVWKAHANAILGVSSWGTDRIITSVFIQFVSKTILTPECESVMAGITNSSYGNYQTQLRNRWTKHCRLMQLLLQSSLGCSMCYPSIRLTSVLLQCVLTACHRLKVWLKLFKIARQQDRYWSQYPTR